MNDASRLASVLIAVMAVGCATSPTKIKTMSAKECAGADWRAIGLEDGKTGRHTKAMDQRTVNCAKAGVTPDAASYDAGYQEGLASFCRPQSGYDFGARGREYLWVCPDEVEPAFIDGYQVGLQMHDIKDTLLDADRNVQRAERDMRQARIKLKRYESQMLSNNVSQSDRMRLRNEVDILAREMDQIDADRLRYTREFNDAKNAKREFEEKYPQLTATN